MSGLAEQAFGGALELGPATLRFSLVYDVCHNIAKFEDHVVDGRRRRVCVHRKGATRAFGPGHPALAPQVRALGQPVIIPGDMGRYSFVLVGTARAMEETFGTTGVHRDFVYALPELGIFVRHVRSANALVLRGPDASAIVGPVNTAG